MVGEVVASFIWLVLLHLVLFALNENGFFRRWWSRKEHTVFFTSNRLEGQAVRGSHQPSRVDSNHVAADARHEHSHPNARDGSASTNASSIGTLQLPSLQTFSDADNAALQPAVCDLLRQAGESNPAALFSQHLPTAHALLERQVLRSASPPTPRSDAEGIHQPGKVTAAAASGGGSGGIIGTEQPRPLTAETVAKALLLSRAAQNEGQRTKDESNESNTAKRRPATYFAFDVHDANHLSESRFLRSPASAILLLFYRAAAALYCAATILVIRFAGEGLQPVFVTYFTHWNVLLLGLYGLLGAGCSARWLLRHHPDLLERFRWRARRERHRVSSELEAVSVVPTPDSAEASDGGPTPLRNASDCMRAANSPHPLPPARAPYSLPRGISARYDALDKAFALSLVTVATSSVFLTLVYWVKIYPAEDHSKSKVDLDNLMRHGINIVVTLGDVLLSRAPVCGYWFHAVLAYVTVYCIFFAVYTTVLSSPYPSLTGSGVFYKVVLLTLVLLGSFVVTYLVAVIREQSCRRRGDRLQGATRGQELVPVAQQRGCPGASRNVFNAADICGTDDSAVRSQEAQSGVEHSKLGVASGGQLPSHIGYVGV